MSRRITSYGASVQGVAHSLRGVPNQDAWLRAGNTTGSLIVVCDGMGSKPHARRGAQEACLAVREAVFRWTRTMSAPVSCLIELIETLWRLRIHPYEPVEAATTCLFAFAGENGEWTVGGIGDGLVAVRTEGEALQCVIGEVRNGFCNETDALGGTYAGQTAWKVRRFPSTSRERYAVLSTDGLSDDLQPLKRDAFCDWLVSEFSDLEANLRWRRLAGMLKAWPTAGHSDDKTIAVLRVAAE